MGLLGGLFGQLVVQLPILAVLVVGGVLLLSRRDRLPRRSATLGATGLGLLLLSALSDTVWFAALPALFSTDGIGYGGLSLLSFAAGALLSLLHAAGIGMLVAALLSRAQPAPGPGLATPGAYQPPASPYGPGYPYPQPGAPGTPQSGATPPAPQPGWGAAPQHGWTPPDPPRY